MGPPGVVVDRLVGKTHPLASLASAGTVTDASTVLINCDDSDLHFTQYKLMGSAGYQQQTWPAEI